MRIFFSLPNWIGKRFIIGCNRKSIISFVSIISIISLSFSIALLIVVLSVMHGFENELKKRILFLVPHIEMIFNNQKNFQWKKIISTVQKIPKISNVTPYVNFVGFIENKNKLKAVQIKGLNINLEKNSSTLLNFIKKKSCVFFNNGKNQIILGKEVAKYLDIQLNDWVTIIFNKNNKLINYKHIFLKVIGILETNSIIDNNFAIIPLSDAQKYLNIKNSITGIAIKADNPFDINMISNIILKKFNFNFYITNWMNKYGDIYREIIMIKTLTYIAMTIIIIIIFINNISILIMIMKDKTKDIAILKTLGAKNFLIKKIFLYYSLIISLISGVIGISVGIIISFNINIFIKIIEYIFDKTLFFNNIYFINFLPSELKFIDIYFIISIIIILSILVSFYPSKQANSISLISLINKN